MFGIMFGGFIKGIEKEGLIIMLKPLFVLGGEKFILMGSKDWQRRPFTSNGSMITAF